MRWEMNRLGLYPSTVPLRVQPTAKISYINNNPDEFRICKLDARSYQDLSAASVSLHLN